MTAIKLEAYFSSTDSYRCLFSVLLLLATIFAVYNSERITISSTAAGPTMPPSTTLLKTVTYSSHADTGTTLPKSSIARSTTAGNFCYNVTYLFPRHLPCRFLDRVNLINSEYLSAAVLFFNSSNQ